MTVLLLGGTSDAKRVAEGLVNSGTAALITLAGATRKPAKMPLPTVVGGFGGREGFVAFLKEHSISRVLDATHPFASQITDRTAEVCKNLNLPHCIFVRDPWTAEQGDHWIEIEREEDAANHIPNGQTVFLGTGRQTLDRFVNLDGCHVICRQIDPPKTAFPFGGGEFLIGRPPFSIAEEVELFRARKIQWLVVKNAGGELSKTKLIAARQLGIPVLMIKRPPLPKSNFVSDVPSAVKWARDNG